MGRPAWATDDQWTWLKSQATEYLKIKGKKGETKKFWPIFLDGWKEQWPKPALTDLVYEGIRASTGSSTADLSTADASTADTSTADTSTADTSTADASTADASTADPSTTDVGNEAGADKTTTADVNAGQGASTRKGKKSAKPLTVSVVRTGSLALRIGCTNIATEIETMDEQPHSQHVLR
jgi:cytoskeletal protein RodZ